MLKVATITILGLAVAGCGTYVPARVQVKDVGSGRTYETYATWGKENMIGYSFYDVDSGNRVMLKSYETKVLQPAKFARPGSAEAEGFLADQRRVAAVGK